jgi:branched-chain amino acid transport system permease protein
MTCGVHLQCSEVLLQLLAIGLSNGAIIALNAIGVTLVYGAVRTINFAYGDLFALTSIVITTTIGALGLHAGLPLALLAGGMLLALGAGMACAVGLNVVVERVAFRPFRGSSRLAPLIATVGVSFILYQAALIWHTAQINGPEHHSDIDNLASVPRGSIPELLPKINLVRAAGINLDITYTLKDLLVLLLAAALALLVSWFLQRTTRGRALRACSQDAELAELCGVNRNGIIRLAFAIGGGLAAGSAFIFALYYNRPFGQHGVQSGLIAFAAAVLGGIGSPIGAFASGLLLGVLAAMSDYFLAAQWTPVLVLGILILMLLLRPTGLAAEEQSGDAGATPAVWVVGKRGPGRMRWLTGALLILGLAYPLLDQWLAIREQAVMTNILLFALLALGLNVLLGFAGLLDLGYAAIFAIGGYTAAMLLGAGGGPRLDFLLVLVASAAVAGLFGLLNGALTLRLRDDYLAIVTLAFGQLVPQVALNLDTWTGGKQGIAALAPPRILTWTFQHPVARYYLALGLLALIALACQRVATSRLGRSWAAMSADEAAAASSGINIARAKLLAFTLGAVIAGSAGALFASIFSYVDSDQSDFTVSAMVLAMVIIGGTGSVRGAILGALLVAGYNQFAISRLGTWVEQVGQLAGPGLRPLLAALDPRGLSYLFFGLALYVAVLLRTRDRADGGAGDASARSLGLQERVADEARSSGR